MRVLVAHPIRDAAVAVLRERRHTVVLAGEADMVLCESMQVDDIREARSHNVPVYYSLETLLAGHP